MKRLLLISLLFVSMAGHAQEMGVNFNHVLSYAEDVDRIEQTNTTWVRGFFDFFLYYRNQDRLTDVEDQLEDFLNLRSQGFKTILSIKWNFHGKSIPDTTSTEIQEYNKFMQALLDRVWGKINIIVVGNEPFIESISEERSTVLPPFYQYMCNRVHEYKAGKEDIPIYFGALNRLYEPHQRTDGVKAMLDFVKKKPWITGIDLHIHHKENEEITSMYSWANDRIRDDQKILITEFSLVWWWKDHIKDNIPAEFATKYGYPKTQLVYEYINYAVNNRRPKGEWDDFLSMSPWFEQRKHYLWNFYTLVKNYPSFNVATYSFRIDHVRNFSSESDPWLINNLIAGVTIEDDPETGKEQFNYALIDDFFKILEESKK